MFCTGTKICTLKSRGNQERCRLLTSVGLNAVYKHTWILWFIVCTLSKNINEVYNFSKTFWGFKLSLLKVISPVLHVLSRSLRSLHPSSLQVRFPSVPYSHCPIVTPSLPLPPPSLYLCTCVEQKSTYMTQLPFALCYFLNYQPPPDLPNTCITHTQRQSTPAQAPTINQNIYSLNSILFPHGLPLINVKGEHFDLSS